MVLRRIFLPVALCLLLLATACQTQVDEQVVASPSPVTVATAVDEATAVADTGAASPTAPSSPEPLPTATATEFPSPTPEPSPTATAVPPDLSITAEHVTLYPVPEIFAGDRVTFQLQPTVPESIIVSDVAVDIYVDGAPVSSDMLTRRNWAGQAEGIYEWVWDTAGQPGEHTVRVVLDPEDKIQEGDEDPNNNAVDFTVAVRSAQDLPLSQANVEWVSAETICCNIHVLSGTAAYRDLRQLMEQVQTAVDAAAARLDTRPEEKIEVYFIDRTIGQGGFAGAEVVVTYIDRNYSGGNVEELLLHEAVHVIDRQFAPQRLKFLAEGAAVWASGGHYKPEDLHERSAALVEIGEYLPLAALIDGFYPVQHEIGYLEAAGFVSYLIDTYGWPTFREFYSNTTRDDGDTESAALSANLQTYYGRDLATMEQEWQAFLTQHPPSAAAIVDLQTTIRYYNVMRRYQMQYDPTAHFLTAWLPLPEAVREQGNTADLLRHPQTDVNVALEAMLVAAEEAMRVEQNYERANVFLDSVTRVLDSGAFVDPLARSYLDIVQIATAMGYEVQKVALEGDSAAVVATTTHGFGLLNLDLALQRSGWMLVN